MPAFELFIHLIRGLMQEAAHLQCARLDRISFKGAVDTLRQFSSALNATKARPRTQERVVKQMLAIIAKETVHERKYRSEPRAVKERPKPYPGLTSHRSVYIVPKSRKIKGTAKTKSGVATP